MNYLVRTAADIFEWLRCHDTACSGGPAAILRLAAAGCIQAFLGGPSDRYCRRYNGGTCQCFGGSAAVAAGGGGCSLTRENGYWSPKQKISFSGIQRDKRMVDY